MRHGILKRVLCMVVIVVCVLLPVYASAASSKVVYILKVNSDYPRMREGVSGSSEIVRTLRKGEKVFYTGVTKNQKCKVIACDGKTGYVYKNYLSLYGAVKKSSVYQTKSAATVYRRSGNSLKKMTTVSKNQYVLVYKTNGTWAYVKSMTGRSGYIKLSSLKKVF